MTDEEFVAWLLSDDAHSVILVEANVQIGGVEQVLYLSDTPYTTHDTHIAYLACINGGVEFEERLSLTGEAQVGAGDIEFDNTDGSLDEWEDYIWVNRDVAVYMGDARWPRAQFRRIFQGVGAQLNPNGRDGWTLALLNKLDRLNHPALEEVLGGTTDNAETLKPHVLGEVHGLKALLTSNNQDFLVHGGGAIEAVLEVRDIGAPRSDVTLSLATGGFRVSGSKTIGEITADVQGAKPGGIYTNNISLLVQYLVKNYGPASQRFTDADLDLTQLAGIAAQFTQPVGIAITDSENTLALAQALVDSIGAQLITTTLGKLRIIPIRLPGIGSPKVVNEDDFVMDSLLISERTEVQSATRLGYCKNWTVQASGTATGLPATSVNLLGTEWLDVTANDTSVTDTYRLTSEPERETTMLLRTVDAQAECDRRNNFRKVPHAVYEAEYFKHLMLTELGDPFTLFAGRYGLEAGKTGIAYTIRRNWMTRRITIGVLA